MMSNIGNRRIHFLQGVSPSVLNRIFAVLELGWYLQLAIRMVMMVHRDEWKLLKYCK